MIVLRAGKMMCKGSGVSVGLLTSPVPKGEGPGVPSFLEELSLFH
jgi:hypothetical protein